MISAPEPYGLGFSVNVPLINVLLEASDASALSSGQRFARALDDGPEKTRTLQFVVAA
ncbi:MAG: hypothetical protein ACLPUT_05715 [Solirubrobacteraceae bacterium]